MGVCLSTAEPDSCIPVEKKTMTSRKADPGDLPTAEDAPGPWATFLITLILPTKYHLPI